MRPASRSLPIRALAGLLALLIAGYGAACWYLWAEQRELIFLPSREVRSTPTEAHLPYTEVWLPVGAADSTVLNGWWLQADDPSAPALLYLHGNDSNIGGNLDHVARLRRMGFSVLSVDYRGYGKSGGAFPSERQMYEDAEIAWEYLIGQRQTQGAPTLIYGHSLGGAIAIELALHHPEAAGVIVEGTFTSMREMAEIHYGMFPIGWLLHQRFDTLAKVSLLRVPVLFVHGTADTEVPYAMSERLFAAARGPKGLALIPGGGHEDTPAVDANVYTRAVQDFVQNRRHGDH
jgi:pimeloyl-ACP methyl ester carboxylesterase